MFQSTQRSSENRTRCNGRGGKRVKKGFAQQIGEKAQIRNQHSPIANLEHPCALSLAISSCRKVIDKADCRRMFQIGDRRMLVAYFRTEFVRRDLLCKAVQEGTKGSIPRPLILLLLSR